LEDFIKVGWDTRPFVSIQLSTVLVFMAYSVFVGFALGIGGILGRSRVLILASVITVAAIAYMGVGILTYSIGVITQR
jgi:hypothetical protein